MNKKKFYIYSLIVFAVFMVATSLSGLFNIGILSDTFGDAYTAVNSTFKNKITNNLEYIDTYRYRPVLFLTLKGIVNINSLLGLSYDNFIVYKLVNIFLYLIFSFISGIIVLKITDKVNLSVLTVALVLIYPNNMHNLCWSAAYFEILCGVFFLMAFLFLVEFLRTEKYRFFVYSNILFILAILTKEIAITFPFVCIIILFLMYGKIIFKKYKSIYISQLIILLVYFVTKTFLSIGIPIVSGKYFGDDFFIKSVQVILKGIIASVIPLDFSIVRVGIKEFNVLLLIYFLITIIFIIIIIIGIIKQKRINVLLLIVLNFLILISPYIYAGYIRPQLILLPFTITFVLSVCFIEFKSSFAERFFIVIIIFWLFFGFNIINSWKTAYTEGRMRIDNILSNDFSKNKKIIIIGNPARLQQCFMCDNVMFPYNYFKYKSFIVKDTLYDFVRTVALDEESLNSELKINNLAYKVYEITCTGKTQFFYVDGEESQKTKYSELKNDFISIEFLENNDLGKPIKIKVKILSDNTENYIFQGKNLIRLN